MEYIIVLGSILVSMFFLVIYMFMTLTSISLKNYYLKTSLAYLMKATQQAASELEGYTDEQVFAMRRAARELGLKWVAEYDKDKAEHFYHLEPKLSEYIEKLGDKYTSRVSRSPDSWIE